MFRVLALIIDFRSEQEAANLACQIARSALDGISVRIVHVDNGNTVPSQLSTAEQQLGIELLRVPRNDGYAGGIIAAYSQLASEPVDALWFLNSDLEVAPDCLQRLVAALAEYPQAGAVGPRVYRGKTAEVWGARGVVSPLLGRTAMIDWPMGGILPKWSYIPGCSLLVRTQAYHSVGGLPDRYRMYFEETEFCIRLQKTGWQLCVDPKAVAFHHVNSVENGVPAPHFAFYFARNNLYFWWNNFRIPWFVQIPRTLLVTFKALILPLHRAKNFRELTSRLGYVLAGLWDGFSFLKSRWTYFERKLFKVDSAQ